ncbi:MAG: biopolymer transporter ExbD [Pseudomonadota bacterium]
MSLSFQKHSIHLQNIQPKMNLVALMDIFTILIFFLMLNFNPDESRSMPSVVVPQSSTNDLSSAQWALILDDKKWSIHAWEEGELVSNKAPQFNGALTGDWQQLLISALDKLPALQATLQKTNAQSSNTISSETTNSTNIDESIATKLVIVADKNLSFETINPILEICHSAGLAAVSLAVASESEQ